MLGSRPITDGANRGGRSTWLLRSESPELGGLVEVVVD